MALALVRDKRIISADVKVTKILATFDNSYDAGGEDFDAPSFIRGDTLLMVHVVNKDGYVFEYDIANKKILARVSGTTGAPLDDEGATTDLSVTPGQVEVLIFHFGA